MPTLQSSSFELSPFTLSSPAASSIASTALSTSTGRAYRRKREHESNDTAAEEDAERKKRRQEQNRKAAATSRVNNRRKRNRLEQQVTQLEEANERLKRLRQTLEDSNTTLTSSTSPALSTPAPPVGRVLRNNSRESAVLVRSLPWNILQLIHNKPHIQRALTTCIVLAVLLTLSTAGLLLLASSSLARTTSTSTSTLSSRPALPLSRPSTPSFSSLPSSLQLLSSLLSLSSVPPPHSSPSQPVPTLRPAFPFSPHLLTSQHLSFHSPPMLRVSSQRRRLTLSHPPRAANTALLTVAGVRAGITGEAVASVQLRAGRSVAERVWTRAGVRFQSQLRGTNASVSVNERVGSPPWLLAVLMVTAMVS